MKKKQHKFLYIFAFVLFCLSIITVIVLLYKPCNQSTNESIPLDVSDGDFNHFIDATTNKFNGASFTKSNELETLEIKYKEYNGSLVLVDATDYKSDIEVYERVYLNLTQTGAFIKRDNFQYKGNQFETAIMRRGVGGITYQVITGVKKANYGYYVSFVIPNLQRELTDLEIEKALKFDLYSESNFFLDIILEAQNENFADSLFREATLDMLAVEKFRETSLQLGGGEFPSTF